MKRAPRPIRRLMAAMMRGLPGMITCRQFEDLLIDYLQGDLPPSTTRLMNLHLRYCKACDAYLKRYRRTIEQGRRAYADPDARVPAEVPDSLVQAVLDARRAEQAEGRR